MWHARQTTMTMQELRDKVIRPAPAKSEAEVGIRLEEWNEARVFCAEFTLPLAGMQLDSGDHGVHYA